MPKSQVCEPVEPVKLFEAKLKPVKPRKKGSKPKTKVELVPTSLRTPQARKSETPRSRPSKCLKITHHGAAEQAEVHPDPHISDWQDEGSIFVPFDLPSLRRAQTGNVGLFELDININTGRANSPYY
jgi:hypothetical protein